MDISNRHSKVLMLDGQIFQTEAWDRGMGKYMLQLMKQLSELKPANIELKILFNSQIDTNIERYKVIEYLCPNFEHLFADLPYAKNKGTTSHQYKKALDDYISDRHDSTRLVYMITTLFSFDIFSEYPSLASQKAMIFYDLIPLLKWSDLGGYFPPHLYMNRFKRVYESDIVYCISETTRMDVVRTFGIDINKTVNINGGFTEHHLAPVKPKSFNVPKKYILFPTGNLPHKNNELVFKAFDKVLKEADDIYLLVTSKFSDSAKNKLLSICSNNIIFTQNVSDEELQYLYKNAAMILFASKYEGLGLPVLDAVFHKKPVVASSISVFKEMSKNAFFYFDVESSVSASKAILKALDIEAFRKKEIYYPEIINKYDWKSVGSSVYSHIKPEEQSLKNEISTNDQLRRNKDLSVAIVSLNPGIKNTIGRLSERLHTHINQSFHISYFFDSGGLKHDEMERPTFLDHIDADVYDLGRLTLNKYRKIDYIFYLIDEKALGLMTSRYVANLPGYVIFDSTVNRNSIIYKAITKETLGSLLIDDEDSEVLDRVEGYIRDTIDAGAPPTETVKVLKSYIPNRIKLAYLKRSAK